MTTCFVPYRWLCALIGMVVVGISVICVSIWKTSESIHMTAVGDLISIVSHRNGAQMMLLFEFVAT